MKILCLYIFIISIIFSSCVEFLKAYSTHMETGREDGTIGYHYRVYFENKTNETIIIFYSDGIRLGSIRKGKVKIFNVAKHSAVYMVGKNSQKQYFSINCSFDQMTVVIE